MNAPCTPCGAASCHPPSFPPAADALNKNRSCQNRQNITHTAAINGMGGGGGLHVSTWLNSFTTFISTENIRSLFSHPILYLHTHIKNVTTSRFCQLHRKGLTFLLHLCVINQQGDHLCGLEGVRPVAAT